ncbi:enoyl-CoA hydratase/isomerase family protein [Flavobacteriales bacterium]|nr:enoyl-CoA hydratase/isomerase family protein [Flavobacteriales bacterium]
MQGSVTLEIKNNIGTIVFFHPQSNSLPSEILNKLASTISQAGTNDEIKVVIIKSKGDRAFCAGASFDELSSIDNFSDGKKFFMGFANVINACRKCPKLIICRVQGKAVGGGVGLACAGDYCLATGYASVKLSELAVGIGPFVVGPAVEKKSSVSAYSTLSINATKWFTASWAREKGIYSEVYDTNEEMDQEINKLAENLTNSNPEAMKKLKEAIWSNTDHWDELLEKRAEYSGQLVLSDFTKNAIARFKSK